MSISSTTKVSSLCRAHRILKRLQPQPFHSLDNWQAELSAVMQLHYRRVFFYSGCETHPLQHKNQSSRLIRIFCRLCITVLFEADLLQPTPSHLLSCLVCFSLPYYTLLIPTIHPALKYIGYRLFLYLTLGPRPPCLNPFQDTGHDLRDLICPPTFDVTLYFTTSEHLLLHDLLVSLSMFYNR